MTVEIARKFERIFQKKTLPSLQFKYLNPVVSRKPKLERQKRLFRVKERGGVLLLLLLLLLFCEISINGYRMQARAQASSGLGGARCLVARRGTERASERRTIYRYGRRVGQSGTDFISILPTGASGAPRAGRRRSVAARSTCSRSIDARSAIHLRRRRQSEDTAELTIG